ncbi:MAG: TonB-dependent receptor [Acidobacteriota bacterium]
MRLGTIATLLLLSASALLAQAVTGTILGTVTDPTGAVVPGAAVKAVNVLTGETKTASTDPAGNYLFVSLPVGEYRIEVEAAGFMKFIRQGIVLTVNRNARADIALQVGQVSEQLQVTGDVPLVDTHQVQMGALVDSRRIRELPLSGRNVYSFASILPGVTSASMQTIFTREGNTLRVNGSRTRHSTFLLDGGFNNSHWRNAGNAAPNPDAIQEFNLITNNYNAEYGRSAGAVVNVVTRSGTNEFHGTLYEFLRNDRLNARNFFVPTVSPLRQNQFGASLGGPVRRNRIFFFSSWESLLIRSNQFVNSGRTPSEAERRGDFSASPARQLPVDPVTRQPFPSGIIPVSRFDPVAVNIISKEVPAPNTPDGRLEVLRGTPSAQHQGFGKVDYLLSASHRLSGNFFRLSNYRFVPFSGGTQIPSYGEFRESYRQDNSVITQNWVVSAALLNEFRFTYMRNFYNNRPLNVKTWSDYGSRIPLAAEFHKPFPPDIRLTGRWRMGAENDNQGQRDYSIVFNDIVSWTRAAHNFKFGSWFSRDRYDATLSLSGAGILTVGGEFTNNALSDFMLGRATSLRQTNGTLRMFRKWDWQSFFQDDWKVHRRLTLNLGLRYELYPRFYSLRKDQQTFRPGRRSTVIPGAPLGLQFEGDPGISPSMAPLDKNNVAPRFGIAWDVTGSGKTAVRAGYGVFYSTPHADSGTYLQQQPFQTDITVFGIDTLVDPYARFPGGTPFPPKVDPNNPFFTYPITIGWMDEFICMPYVQQYSFAIQQQIPWNASVQIAYVGNTSRKLVNTRDANQAVFVPGRSTSANVNDRRPIMPGTYGQISKFESSSNAHYDSLQISVDRRFANNFSILFNYTFAKSIDEVSDEDTNPVAVALADANNRRLDRAVSDADTRHIMNLSYIWDLPRLNSWSRWAKWTLGGWQFNGILRIRSGNAVNVTAGRDVNLDGRSTDRPNLVGDPRLDSGRPRADRIRQYFNTAAFELPVTGALGTAGRNLFYGPGDFNWDLALFKNFPIREAHHLTFRAEFFNFPNRVNLGNPVNTLTSANFGRILSAGSARVTQFGLKYSF